MTLQQLALAVCAGATVGVLTGAALIVSVVTIFSILIAYYEFMRRGEDK